MDTPTPVTSVRYAGFWIRLVADILDSVVLLAVSWLLTLMAFGIVFWVSRSDSPFSDIVNPLFTQVIVTGFYVLAALPYYVIGHYRYGTTLGKLPFKICVVSANGLGPITQAQSWTRCLSYALSGAPFMAGFLMAGIHPQKRALHDLIAGTVSIRKARELS